MMHFGVPELNFSLDDYINEKADDLFLDVNDVVVSKGQGGVLEYRLVQEGELPPEQLTVSTLKKNGYLRVLVKNEK